MVLIPYLKSETRERIALRGKVVGLNTNGWPHSKRCGWLMAHGSWLVANVRVRELSQARPHTSESGKSPKKNTNFLLPSAELYVAVTGRPETSKNGRRYHVLIPKPCCTTLTVPDRWTSEERTTLPKFA